MRGADIRRAVIRRQHQNQGGFAGMEGTARRQPGECRKGLFFQEGQCRTPPMPLGNSHSILHMGAAHSPISLHIWLHL